MAYGPPRRRHDARKSDACRRQAYATALELLTEAPIRARRIREAAARACEMKKVRIGMTDSTFFYLSY